MNKLFNIKIKYHKHQSITLDYYQGYSCCYSSITDDFVWTEYEDNFTLGETLISYKELMQLRKKPYRDVSEEFVKGYYDCLRDIIEEIEIVIKNDYKIVKK